MKNNKVLLYAGLLLAGVCLGWLFFGNGAAKENDHDHNEMAETNQTWTCSMHPQIKQPEPGDCPICGMELIPMEASENSLGANQFRMTENAMALANIQTTIVGEGSNSDGSTIKLSGTVMENEENNSVQASYFKGRIERLLISFTGQEVRKGQLLATIYAPELYAAQQELLTAASLKESQPALYQAVRNKLKLWKLSESQINQIEETGKIKENFPVYATVSGTVTEKLVAQGDYVAQGQPLLKIANLQSVWANFDVYENQISEFKKGQQVQVTTKAYPNKTFQGTVDFIDPTLNPQTRTVTLRVVLNNKDGIFKPGMFVTANVQGKKNAQVALSIPASAVLWTGERSLVYLKTSPDQPIFEMKEITLGNQIGEQYEVVDGLSAGDEIVVNGTFTVDAAAQLQGKKSMMNQGTTKSASQKEVPQKTLELDASFETAFVPVIQAYLTLKDVLVESDTAQAMQKSARFQEALQTLSKQQREQLQGHWEEMMNAASTLEGQDKIGLQRKSFQEISDRMIETVKNFKSAEQTLFVQYCPMADQNKGAYWLSKEEKIQNPYFGEVMLTCGTVTEILK